MTVDPASATPKTREQAQIVNTEMPQTLKEKKKQEI
jgi:hypothetical protein